MLKNMNRLEGAPVASQATVYSSELYEAPYDRINNLVCIFNGGSEL